MKIVLIRPAFGEIKGRRYKSLAMMEPLNFAVLAGLTPSNHQIVFFDERIEDLKIDGDYDLAAISVDTFSAKRAYQISEEFKKRKIPVILGGFHPTLVPEEAALFSDSVAIGEADAIWPQILADAQNGTLKKFYHSENLSSQFSIKCDRSIFTGKPYIPMALVSFNQGCIHNCDFCSIRQFYQGRIRQRRVSEVVSEISTLNRKSIFFVDDNIVSQKDVAKQLFREIKGANLKWAAQASLSIVEDDELLGLAVESGCFALIIGLESLNPMNLEKMNKGWAKRFNGYSGALDKLRKNGILVYGTFVFGYDHDDLDCFERTADFAIEKKLFMANFNVLQPFPGTPLYTNLKRENRLVFEKWWLDPGYRWNTAAFFPLKLTPQQLSDGVMSARKKFNSISGIFRRGLDFQANFSDFFRAWIYLTGNIVSRHDIHRKSNLKLGLGAQTLK
ncbi:MAG: B12-binding domain-containing radical SAM protein [Candidatus Riflebacteria bacterium]|nr:B12-binding domain-containing radical SAM protein [Candidatus Riflebacteria bacterium]